MPDELEMAEAAFRTAVLTDITAAPAAWVAWRDAGAASAGRWENAPQTFSADVDRVLAAAKAAEVQR